MDPAGEGEQGGTMFPTGQLVDDLEVPGVGTFKATLINAGIPTIFVKPKHIGYTGHRAAGRHQRRQRRRWQRFETILQWGAPEDGPDQGRRRGRDAPSHAEDRLRRAAARLRHLQRQAVRAAEVDLLVRALSMGQLHHAMMGTAAVAIGAAAAVPGTLVNLAAGGGERRAVRFGHPSGMLGVGAEVAFHRRPVGRHQGADEPQRARADGRLGGGAGMKRGPSCPKAKEVNERED